METQETTLATQATPEPSQAATPQATPAAEAKTPFLRVDDRTVYDTQEAAIEGWKSLSKFRQDYSGLTDRFKLYGADDVETFFRNLDFTIDEYEKMKKAMEGKPASPAAATPPAQSEPQKFLTREEFETLREQERQQQADESRVQEAVGFGQSVLKELMSAAKLPVTDDDVLYVRGLLEDSIIRQSKYDSKTGKALPGSLEHRYVNGTNDERRAIVDAEFKKFMRYAAAPQKADNAEAARNKTAALAAQPKPVPASASSPAAVKRRTPEEIRDGLQNILFGGAA